MTSGEGWILDRPLNQELGLLAQLLFHHDRVDQRLHYCKGSVEPSPAHHIITPEQAWTPTRGTNSRGSILHFLQWNTLILPICGPLNSQSWLLFSSSSVETPNTESFKMSPRGVLRGFIWHICDPHHCRMTSGVRDHRESSIVYFTCLNPAVSDSSLQGFFREARSLL